jgi:flagellar capping protein FliD
MEWTSEEMAEDLARYVDAYNEEPDMVASFLEWNKSYGSSEWKNKQTTKFSGDVTTRVMRWQFNLMRYVCYADDMGLLDVITYACSRVSITRTL